MNKGEPDIGQAIRQIRKKMSISLDKASQLTGVSKAMLGQIERRESTPTISTLWKISTGLKVMISNLLEGSPDDCSVIDIKEVAPLQEEKGKMLLYNIFPFNPVSGFDYFHITLEPHCIHKSVAHANVVMEYIVVIKGTLEMTVNDKTYVLKEKTAFSFPGLSEHTYANMTDEELVFQNIIKYR